MPYVILQITKGATGEQKATVNREFTRTLRTVFGKKPEQIHIVIQEIDTDDRLASAARRVINTRPRPVARARVSPVSRDEPR